MKSRNLVVAAVCIAVSALAQAVTLRMADQGDVQSMDPHSLNESLQLSFTGNVYEQLIERGKDMNLAPALATKWTQQSPTVWRFDLRPNGVTLQDRGVASAPFLPLPTLALSSWRRATWRPNGKATWRRRRTMLAPWQTLSRKRCLENATSSAQQYSRPTQFRTDATRSPCSRENFDLSAPPAALPC